MSTSSSLVRAIAAMTLPIAFACTTPQTLEGVSPDQSTIEACEAYVTAHVSCFGRSGAREQEAASAEGEQMRAQYRAAALDPARRDETRAACASSLARMKTACP